MGKASVRTSPQPPDRPLGQNGVMDTAPTVAAHLLDAVRAIFRSQKRSVDRAVAQLTPEQLHAVPDGGNSIATIRKHMAGNMQSRWTDFLTSDGEKPWRGRDQEFEVDDLSPDAEAARWEAGWQTLFDTMDRLGEDDLLATVRIRGEEHTVIEAILRQVHHYGYHVGQIVQRAKAERGELWEWLSVPPGRSAQFEAEMRARHEGGGSDA